MSESIRSYRCGCDIGDSFTHLCGEADHLEGNLHWAQWEVETALMAAHHLVTDAHRDEWTEPLEVRNSKDMRFAANRLREHAEELEVQAERCDKALSAVDAHQYSLSQHFSSQHDKGLYKDVYVEEPPEDDE